MFRPTVTHREEVLQIYNAHHAELNRQARAALREHGRCLVVDLHSFSDETVTRLFGWTDFPDVCIGTEEEYYDKDLVNTIACLCRSVGLSVAMNYPYRGSMVPNQYYGKRGTGIVSVMLEINKRVLHGG